MNIALHCSTFNPKYVSLTTVDNEIYFGYSTSSITLNKLYISFPDFASFSVTLEQLKNLVKINTSGQANQVEEKDQETSGQDDVNKYWQEWQACRAKQENESDSNPYETNDVIVWFKSCDFATTFNIEFIN